MDKIPASLLQPSDGGMMASIASVERDTGLSKDVLRIWERRYGFPRPLRDPVGERVYPADQVLKLRLLHRLIGAGHRPGRLMDRSIEELQALVDQPRAAPAQMMGADAEIDRWMELLARHEVAALRRELLQAQWRLGLARFVVDKALPFTAAVGEAWMRGRLQVYQEHVFSEVMQGVLRQAIASVPAPEPGARPRVLLTTFPNEPHGLGLLMAEALLALDGCDCLSLGVQTPLGDIVQAAQAHDSDVVTLSFASAPGRRLVHEGLTELRAALPERVQLWVGGLHRWLRRHPLPGVASLASLTDLTPAVAAWRASQE
jgi:methylmalonyl-CoA mutase cobalamin-binding subunit/DNA-binding transcriptional MerR regulator